MNPLETRVGPLTLDNPVMPAAGSYGYGIEFADLVDLNRLGALVLKSVTLEPRSGKPPPRMIEVTGGILHSGGVPNEGVEYLVEHVLPQLAAYNMPVIASVAGDTPDEHARVSGRLEESGRAAAYEPNLVAADSPCRIAETVEAVCETTARPVIAKLAGNAPDCEERVQAAERAGASALTISAPLPGLAIDPIERRFRLGSPVGVLSGPAVKPHALYVLTRVRAITHLPLIASGGITGWWDAAEFLLAGASAVQVGSFNYVQPNAMVTIVDDLLEWVSRQGAGCLSDLIGTLHPPEPM